MGASDEPRVRAVVVNLNGGALIGECLQSLMEQDFPRLATIVVDNGSTDGSVAMLRERFPNVVLIENGRNLGFGGANNIGMQRALSDGDDFVFLLNYDATAAPTCVSALVARAIGSGAGMVGPKILYHDEPTTIWSAGGVIHWWRGAVAHRGIRRHDYGVYDLPTDVDYLTACALLIDTRVLRLVGMFDDAYHPSYFEDTDLCQRARRAGYRLIYEPEAIVWHRVSSFSGGGTTPLKVRLRLRNQLLFFRRHARWFHWITIPPCAAAGLLLIALRWVIQGRWGLLRALAHGLRAAMRHAAPADGSNGP